MKKILLSLLIWLWVWTMFNVSYAADDLKSLFWETQTTTETNTTDWNKELWWLQKALWTILSLFYFNFYNEFLNGFFWSIPWVWQEFVNNNAQLLWWLAVFISILTLLIYLFADAKWWSEWWDNDLRKVIANLIESIRKSEKTWNEKTILMITFAMIIISIFLLTLLISFLFTKLIIKSTWIVTMFYNLIIWLVWFSMIFLVVKWIYINWIVEAYLWKETTREEVLKKWITYLWFIVIWIVFVYNILDWLKNTLTGW